MTESPLDKLRGLCLSHPGVMEKLSHGTPSWFTKKRQIVIFSGQHEHNREACWCMAPPGIQEALIAERPDCFFRPPYVGPKGWIGVYLDVAMDWDEIADRVHEAYDLGCI